MSAVSSPAAGAADLVERLTSEGLIGMSAAAKLAGSYRAGKPTHPSTVTRWVTDGVRLDDGRVVRLEAIRFGNRLVTSKPAFHRFLEAQQTDGVTQPTVRPPAARRKAATRAGAELEEMGA